MHFKAMFVGDLNFSESVYWVSEQRIGLYKVQGLVIFGIVQKQL
jgi:hypothetical protein